MGYLSRIRITYGFHCQSQTLLSISIAAAVGAADLQGVLLPHAALLLGVFVFFFPHF